MSNNRFDFTVIGGDLRFVCLAEFLLSKGFAVSTYGIAAKVCHLNHYRAKSLEEAIRSTKMIIGPIPLSKKTNEINHVGSLGDMTVEHLVDLVGEEQRLFAGCISEQLKFQLLQKEVLYYDFMDDNPTTIFNSIATAEGIIAEAIIAYPSNLHDSNVLVLGYGRCGKTLAQKLSTLVKKTTVCARNSEHLAQAHSFGLDTVFYHELKEIIPHYHLIFNTVPGTVLDLHLIKKMNQNTMIFDIASQPGGVDLVQAERFGIQAKSYPGLPGKYSPKASGEALAAYIIETVNK